MAKKDFDSEFNRICEDKRAQKEYKKNIFKRNIQPRIVYMDENGNIIKKQKNSYISSDKNYTLQSQRKSRKSRNINKVFYTLLAMLLVAFIIYMLFDLYACCSMIY